MPIRIFNQRFSCSELWELRPGITRVALRPAKLTNFLIAYLSRIALRPSVGGLPPFLMLEPSSRCNMSCPMCPFLVHQEGRYNPVDMSIDKYRRLMDELGPTLLTLSLWGWGEPLLNEYLPEMIRYARKYNIFVSVSTNSYLMDRGYARDIIASGLDYLIFSVDGATEETYSKYRGKGKFERVIHNIRILQEEKKRLNTLHPFTNLQFIVMRENEHEVSLIKKLAGDLGVNKLSLKKVGLIDEADKEKLLPIDVSYIHRIYREDLDDRPCSRPWNTPFITASGDVIVCCGDIRYVYNFGNVFEKGSFGQIWNGPEFRKFRKHAATHMNQIEMCRRCPAKSFEDGFVS